MEAAGSSEMSVFATTVHGVNPEGHSPTFYYISSEVTHHTHCFSLLRQYSEVTPNCTSWIHQNFVLIRTWRLLRDHSSLFSSVFLIKRCQSQKYETWLCVCPDGHVVKLQPRRPRRSKCYALQTYRFYFILRGVRLSLLLLRPLLAYCTSPKWQVMVIVEKWVEWRLAGGHRSTRRKPAPAPLCPPQITHD
jgi:hypothetical protein